MEARLYPLSSLLAFNPTSHIYNLPASLILGILANFSTF